MANEITLPEQKTAFKFHEDSNYLVLTSFKDEFIIEAWQFKKLLGLINSTQVDFVSINDSLVNKRYIQLIQPTTRRTPEEQSKFDAAQKVEEQKYQDNETTASGWVSFSDNWMNNKFGVGQWKSKVPYLKQIREDYENQNR